MANDQLRQLRVERAKSQELIDKLQADLQGRKRDASRLNKVDTIPPEAECCIDITAGRCVRKPRYDPTSIARP